MTEANQDSLFGIEILLNDSFVFKVTEAVDECSSRVELEFVMDLTLLSISAPSLRL